MNPQQQQQQWHPEDPIPEVIPEGNDLPVCISQPKIWVVPLNHHPQRPEERTVEVCRRDNPTQAYQRIERFQPKPLSHGGPLWGYMYLGFVLQRRCPPDGDGLYEEPTELSVRRVMIKKLFRPVVEDDLRRGSKENPYKEIHRMKELVGRNNPEGLVHDAYANDHVLGCIDAMVNDKYIYIITPYCENGSLLQHIPLKPNETDQMSVEARGRELYRQMLQNIQYLHEQHGICHRDVDPGNFLVRDDDRILLNDLAMSFRIPATNGGLVNYIGAIGKPPYCPPETLQRGHAFWARQCDLWACTICLWNLLTGLRLYRWPNPSDLIFRYTIMAQGLAPELVNPLVNRVIEETDPGEFVLLSQIAQQILGIRPELLKLFHNVLAMNPNDRWDIQQVLQCDWMDMAL